MSLVSDTHHPFWHFITRFVVVVIMIVISGGSLFKLLLVGSKVELSEWLLRRRSLALWASGRCIQQTGPRADGSVISVIIIWPRLLLLLWLG